MVFKVQNRRLLICNCEKTMELDDKKLKSCLGGEGELIVYSNLGRFLGAGDHHRRVIVGCCRERLDLGAA